MNKISLVQLSQLENKPKEVKFDEEIYLLSKSGKYKKVKDNEDILLHHQIFFEDFNEPLIEIVEEVLLSDEEKEYLKMCIKFSRRRIDAVVLDSYHKYLRLTDTGALESNKEDNTVYLKNEYFKNLKLDKEYYISDLGLYDE